MNFEELAAGQAATAAFWAAGLPGDGMPIEHAGRVSLDVGARLRTLATLSLLAHNDGQKFCANLARSADAWRHFLGRAAAAGDKQVPHRASGRLAPVFDAAAAGDFEALRAIGQVAPTALQRGKEYVDDFCTARAIFALVDEQPIDGMLEQFAAFDDQNPRLPMLTALAQRQQEAFADALAAVLASFELETATMLERGVEDTAEFRITRQVSIESVAWQRLAVLRGLNPAPETTGCPSLALEAFTGKWPRDFSAGRA